MAKEVKWTDSGLPPDMLVRDFVASYHRGFEGKHKATELYFDLVSQQPWAQLSESSKRSISYLEFLTKPILDGGLGSTLEDFESYFHDIDRVMIKHRELISRGKGGDRKSDNTKIKVDNVNIDISKKDDQQGGNSRHYAIEYLTTHGREDLATEVMDKKISANRAMIKAGFRTPSNSVKQTPEDYVRMIRKLFTAEQRRLIASEILQ